MTGADFVVEVSRDWLDYLFALGALLPGVAAVAIALASALEARSAARASRRTAEAAEQTAAASEATATAAREELDMLKAEAEKRPAFELRPEAFPYANDSLTLVLQLGMRNVGQRDAPNTVLNLLAPQGSIIVHCDGPDGGGGRSVPLLATREPVEPGGEPVEWVYLIDRLNLDRGIPNVAFFRIRFPSAGAHSVRIKLGHPDASISGDIRVDV